MTQEITISEKKSYLLRSKFANSLDMVDLPTPFPPVTIIIVVVSEMENKEKFHLNFHFRFHLNFHHEEYLCLC